MSEKIEFEAITFYEEYGHLCVTVPEPLWSLVGDQQKYRVTLEPVEPELKPCPFCGGEAEVRYFYMHTKGWLAQCTTWKCSVRVGPFEKKSEAIAAWNRRADG